MPDPTRCSDAPWRLDPVLYEAVRAAAHAAGVSVQAFAHQALRAAVEATGSSGTGAREGGRLEPGGAGPTAEDHAWLDTDLSRLGEFEPYDWGPDGPPRGRPLRHIPGQGLVVEDRHG